MKVGEEVEEGLVGWEDTYLRVVATAGTGVAWLMASRQRAILVVGIYVVVGVVRGPRGWRRGIVGWTVRIAHGCCLFGDGFFSRMARPQKSDCIRGEGDLKVNMGALGGRCSTIGGLS